MLRAARDARRACSVVVAEAAAEFDRHRQSTLRFAALAFFDYVGDAHCDDDACSLARGIPATRRSFARAAGGRVNSPPTKRREQGMKGICSVVVVVSSMLSLVASAALPKYKVDVAGANKAAEGVVLVQLRQLEYQGLPDGAQAPDYGTQLIEGEKKLVSKGVYSSPYQGYRLLVPKVAGSAQINLHQSVISRRPDGTPITSSVLLVTEEEYGAAAVVVTRIKEGGRKDPESVLAQFEPKNPDEYAMYEQSGVIFRRLDGPFGTSLQRTIKKRGFTWHFPYRVIVDASLPAHSIGVSRYVVMGDFLCEFSVLVAGYRAPSAQAVQLLAEQELDILMGAMVQKPK